MPVLTMIVGVMDAVKATVDGKLAAEGTISFALVDLSGATEA